MIVLEMVKIVAIRMKLLAILKTCWTDTHLFCYSKVSYKIIPHIMMKLQIKQIVYLITCQWSVDCDHVSIDAWRISWSIVCKHCQHVYKQSHVLSLLGYYVWYMSLLITLPNLHTTYLICFRVFWIPLKYILS